MTSKLDAHNEEKCQSGKRFGRGAITCKLVAEMLVNAGLTDILTMDLHHKEIQGGNSIAEKQNFVA